MTDAHRAAAENARRLSLEDRDAEALDVLQRAARRGSSPVLDNALAITLVRLSQLDRALFHAERAAASGAPETLLTLGNIRFMLGRTGEAAAAFRKALDAGFRDAGLLLALANCVRQEHRYDESERLSRESLGLRDSAAGRCYLAEALTRLQDHAAARAVLEGAARDYPDDLLVATSAANLANYDPDLSAEACAAAQRRYGDVLARQVRPAACPISDADPERVLRVGLLSPDLRRHSVASFAGAMLRGLPRDEFRVVCYALHVKDDEVSVALRAHADGWSNVSALGDGAIAERIRADRVDVLLDLSGHTRGHRLGVFQRRAAPVQATYLGYPHLTGVHEMDARLVDTITDPPVASEAGVSERLVRMEPPFVCFTPPPERGSAPVRSPGAPPTFASFNLSAKINGRVLTAWARILESSPGSRLLVKASDLSGEAVRTRLGEAMNIAGIDVSRAEILGPTPDIAGHLALYARADVALDTFPYNGTTTTCEALWQGVPVVTFAGDRHAARVGASLLTAAGVPEFVADDVDGYVRLARDLIADRARVERYRATLRERVRGSSLCDEAAFGRRFGAVLRSLWREACRAGSES